MGRGGVLGRRLFTSITEELVAKTFLPSGWGRGGDEGGILKDPAILAFPFFSSSSFLFLFCQAGEPGIREERKEESFSFSAAQRTKRPVRRMSKIQTARAKKAKSLGLPLL